MIVAGALSPLFLMLGLADFVDSADCVVSHWRFYPQELTWFRLDVPFVSGVKGEDLLEDWDAGGGGHGIGWILVRFAEKGRI